MASDLDHTDVDLLISNARLLDGRVVSIGIEQGRYTFVGPAGDLGAGVRAAARLDAAGGLVSPSFVNAHMHLDKVYTLPLAGESALLAYTGGSMGGALRSIVEDASTVKQHYDRAWIAPNVRRALDEALRFGCTHLQVFVDVDTSAGTEGLEAVLAVREEYRDRVDLQVVAFPQDGVLRDPGAASLCEHALDIGADVVGGIPWVESSDRDSRAHVEWACALAERTGRRVAMLVDDAGDPSLRTTQMFAEAVLDHDIVGRAVACHGRAIGTYPEPTVHRLIELSRRAGLGFVSDPHTGPLHLPVREFLDADLPVALGQDDIEDAYYPFGRNNLLEVAFLGAHLLQFLANDDQARLLDMVTTRAARVLGMRDHQIAVGSAADLCVHRPERLVDLLREHEAPAWVLRNGAVVARTSHAVTERPLRPLGAHELLGTHPADHVEPTLAGFDPEA